MLIDSNILVYAINRISPKHKRASQFLQENTPNLEVAHQNILEALRVLTHPKFPHPMKTNQALEAIIKIVKTCYLISPNPQTAYITLELIKEYHLKSDQVFDAYLVATALSNDVLEIATDNVRDFKRFEQIQVINPFKK